MLDNKIERILKHEIFIASMDRIMQFEKKRIYCKHDILHSLDVARICYILVLENDLSYSKDVIYALALLHDIGRSKQYESGENHSIIGGKLAVEIMHDVGFLESDIDLVNKIILKHSGEHNVVTPKTLEEAFFQADFLSRQCSYCEAFDTCKWKIKNMRKDM